MSLPRVVAVADRSPAARADLRPGDEIVSLSGQVPRDVIQLQLLTDEADLELEVSRGGLQFSVVVEKDAGEPLGAELASALFDRVQTCDNHCEFCFIHQLPPGMRKSLYLKDDDYRLSFLYGNFTTLTRFTEADLERVVTERLSPLYVSIHATDPEIRARMLRNRRGATSLRWLRALLDHGIAVHGQVVVCPGVNDGPVLHDTLAGVLDEYPELASVAVVPLGVSRWSHEAAMRPHTREEALEVVAAVDEWQGVFLATLGRRVVFAADEYYLLAGVAFPPAETYEGFAMHEDGIGMARLLVEEWGGDGPHGTRRRPRDDDGAAAVRGGFFAWVDGAPAAGYRAPRIPLGTAVPTPVVDPHAPIGILTGAYGARVLAPLVDALDRPDVRLVPVENAYFGGNIGVTGLLVGEDLVRTLSGEPAGHRYLLPDVCLSDGVFLDGLRPADLPRPVEVVATDGRSLRRALATRPAAVSA
jgi:putative radical SAM enzyme (TIGR03279 family)